AHPGCERTSPLTSAFDRPPPARLRREPRWWESVPAMARATGPPGPAAVTRGGQAPTPGVRTMFTSFPGLFPAPSPRPAPRPVGRAFPSRLEALEDRTVPSVWFVNGAAGGRNSGLSWAAAFRDLQSALAAAVSGDEIWVAAGTYKPTATADRTVSFALKEG